MRIAVSSRATSVLSFIGVGAIALLFGGCAASPVKQVNTWAVLLPEEGGARSVLTVGEGSGAMTLDSPMSAATVDTKGNIEKIAMTSDEVSRTFAAALAAQPPKAISFLLYFDTNSTEVAPSSRPALAALFDEVAKRQAVEVQVTGHTDRVGAVAANDKLSLVRAEAVRNMLTQRGLKAGFIRAVGRGEREPLVPTPDEQPEARNRRVEVIVR